MKMNKAKNKEKSALENIPKGEVEKRSKRKNLQNLILNAVSLAGIIGVGLLAPNVLGAMYKLGIIPHKRQRESIANSRKKLINKGLLEYKKGNLRITQEGKRQLFREGLTENAKKKNQKWDGKWRVLIFDIPERIRFVRDNIRIALLNIGFMRLQDSVWIYPYDCEDLINLLKADMEIGKDVLYIIVEELEYDKPVREYFGFAKR